ncbi:MAG: cytochrome c [Albidovulum sp.]
MHSLLTYLALTGVALAADAAPNAEALKRLVHQDCGSCHGITLKGGLGPDIRPSSLAHYTSESLTAVILDGVPGTPMPPWRPLITGTEAEWIAKYLLKGDTP